MHPYVVVTLTVLRYIAYPFGKLLQWLYYLLKPLRYLLYILSVPFIHIIHFLGKALCWPVNFLVKLEVRNWIERSTSVLEEHFLPLSPLMGAEKDHQTLASRFENNQMITSSQFWVIPLNIRFNQNGLNMHEIVLDQISKVRQAMACFQGF